MPSAMLYTFFSSVCLNVSDLQLLDPDFCLYIVVPPLFSFMLYMVLSTCLYTSSESGA